MANDAIKWNPDDLTLGEAEDFEEAAGVPLLAVNEMLKAGGGVPVRVVTAMYWIMERRDRPDLTLADVRALKFSEIKIGAQGESQAVGAGEAATAGD